MRFFLPSAYGRVIEREKEKESAMPLFSHYGDLPDSSAALSYTSLVFAIVTPIVVIARLLSRRFLSGRIGADDWTILASCVWMRWQ